MEKGVFIFVVGLAVYIQSAHTSLETVWLKDMTKSFQNDERSLGDRDLPNELTFHLKRGSDALTLNLKRNHAINPNADVYFAEKLQDGTSHLVKSENVEKADVAYYQDMNNGAYMTVRCVKRSNEECDRVINGNVRIGDKNYDLHPAVHDVTSRKINLLEDHSDLGKRYLLQDQAYSGETNSVENVANNKERKEQGLQDLHHFNGQDKNNHFLRADASISSQSVADLYYSAATDKSRRSVDEYYVNVMVMIDPGVWDLYSSAVRTSNLLKKREKVKAKIKEAYSHIMNGVNLRYKEIHDPSISITVTLSGFIIFQAEVLFPRLVSDVEIINGTKYIERQKYLSDLFYWDINGTNNVMDFDQALLFTRYDLYANYTSNNYVNGYSYIGGVCVRGYRFSIIQASDYSLTMRTAAHELGHSLGAVHDGEGVAIACKPSDFFIMAPFMYSPNMQMNYTANPWLFSSCSVQSFKKRLITKNCVKVMGKVHNEQEWKNYMTKQPGEVYSLDEQCHLANGANSRHCGSNLMYVCQFMRCTDPKSGVCLQKYFGAARGTKCHENGWCIRGRCTPKGAN